jgi:hypothetical protein
MSHLPYQIGRHNWHGHSKIGQSGATAALHHRHAPHSLPWSELHPKLNNIQLSDAAEHAFPCMSATCVVGFTK